MRRLYFLKNSVHLKFITTGIHEDVDLRGTQFENHGAKPHKTKEQNTNWNVGIIGDESRIMY